MKKIVKFAASLLFVAGAMISCQKENFTQELDAIVPTSFTASFEQTKVAIDGFTPKFEIGDEIGVEASTGAPMTTAKATFQVTKINADGSADLSIKGSWSGTPVPPYYVYKGSVSTSMIPYGASMMVFNLPYMELNAASDKIDKTVLFGKTDNLENGVTLLNACALLKVTVSEPVKMIKVAAQNGYVSPQVNVNFANNTIMGQNNVNEFVYANATGMIAAGTYYIPFAPTQPAAPLNGLKVGYSTDGTEFIWREKAGSIAIERNKIYDLGSFADWPKPGPVGPTAADFAGTYLGGLKEAMNMGGTIVGTYDYTDPAKYQFKEFVIEATADDNLVLKKYYGNECNVAGTYDAGTRTATFAEGTITGIVGIGVIQTPLILVLSEDGSTLTPTGGTFNVKPSNGAPWIWEGTLTVLTKQGGGASEGFEMTDLIGKTFSVSCKIDGVASTGDLTSTTTGAPGANAFLNGIFGAGTEAYATFDIETGFITLSTSSAGNRITIPGKEVFITDTALGDNIFVMSADKKSISIHEDLGGIIILVGKESGTHLTISDFTATLK